MMEIKEIFKIVFDIFTAVTFLSTLICGGFLLSDSYNTKSTSSLVASMLIVMLLLCGSNMLVQRFIFENPIPLPIKVMFWVAVLGLFVLIMWWFFSEEK